MRSALPRIASLIWPYSLPVLALLVTWPLHTPWPAQADHFSFWAAGHMAATGQSPYERSAWEALLALGPVPGGIAVSEVALTLTLEHVWLYPPQTAFALVPFGGLPVEIGVPAYHFFVLITAVLGVAVTGYAMGLRGPWLAVGLTLALLSMPFVMGVRNGQPIGLLLGAVSLAFVGLRDRRSIVLAVGVAIASLKPQLFLLSAIGALGYVILRRDRTSFVAGALALAAVTVPALIVHPFPFAALTEASAERVALDLSTTSALARDLGGGPVLTLVITLVAVAAAAIAMRAPWVAARGAVAFGLALALSLVVLPYLHHYDHLLILPAAFTALVIATGTRREVPVVVLLLVLLVPVSWLLHFWWPLLGQLGHERSGPVGALPTLALLVLAYASGARR